MASTNLSMVTDARQFRRELAMLNELQSREIAMRIDRGERMIWTDIEFGAGAVIATPRMCFG